MPEEDHDLQHIKKRGVATAWNLDNSPNINY